ncbi:fimbrial protein [Huaxiibacter chinensis]
MLPVVAIRHPFIVLIVLLFSYFCHGAEKGRVNITGSIIKSSCSIDTTMLNHIVLLKTSSTGKSFQKVGSGNTTLRIQFSGCSNIAKTNIFRVTFYGIENRDDGFYSFNHAPEIGMRITDVHGERVQPEKPMLIDQSIAKNNTLDFTFALPVNGELLQAGVYAATLRLKLDYF